MEYFEPIEKNEVPLFKGEIVKIISRGRMSKSTRFLVQKDDGRKGYVPYNWFIPYPIEDDNSDSDEDSDADSGEDSDDSSDNDKSNYNDSDGENSNCEENSSNENSDDENSSCDHTENKKEK